MSLSLQETLLNVLQEREVQRVGGTRTRSVDVRVISATHQKLQDMVAQGTFREDLYYRLCGHQISLPPLRERLSDIPLLVTYFLQRIEAENERARSDISEDAMGLLQTYEWPGNVRELERCLESATVTSQGEVIMPSDLPQEIRTYRGDEGSDRSEPETESSETRETPMDKDHGCIYFGGMTFAQIDWSIYYRAPYLYTDHAEAATALDVDIRTFCKYWPKNKSFPSRHTLFRE